MTPAEILATIDWHYSQVGTLTATQLRAHEHHASCPACELRRRELATATVTNRQTEDRDAD
jgi:hypothetical protein